MTKRWQWADEEPTEIRRNIAELQQLHQEIAETESQVMEVCPSIEPLYADQGGAFAVGDVYPRNEMAACGVHVVLVCMTGEAVLEVREKGRFVAMRPMGHPQAASAPSCRYIHRGVPWRVARIKGRTVAMVVHTG